MLSQDVRRGHHAKGRSGFTDQGNRDYSQKPYYNLQNTYSAGMGESISENVNESNVDWRIGSTVSQIQSNLKKNPLEENEQFNLAGYSTGAVIMAQSALMLAKKGQTIDNLSSGAGDKDAINVINSHVSKFSDDATQILYRTQYGRSESYAQSALGEIQQKIRNNPNAKVVVYGYSYGGKTAFELAKLLNDLKIKTTLITVDAANGYGSDNIDRAVGDFIENYNYYEGNTDFAKDPTLSRGYASTGKNVHNFNKSGDYYFDRNTKITEKESHTNIDEATTKSVINVIKNIFSGSSESTTISGDEFRKLIKQNK